MSLKKKHNTKIVSSKKSIKPTSKKKKKASKQGKNPNSHLALSRWNLVRSAVVSYNKSKGYLYTKKSINQNATAVYSRIKDYFKHGYDNIEEEIEQELFVEKDSLPFLYWWELDNNLKGLPQYSDVFIDVSTVLPNFKPQKFKGSVNEYIENSSMQFIKDMNNFYQRKTYQVFVRFKKQVLDVPTYFYLFFDDDSSIFESPEIFEAWMKEQGLTLADIVGEEADKIATKRPLSNEGGEDGKATKSVLPHKRKIKREKLPYGTKITNENEKSVKSKKKGKKTSVAKRVSPADLKKQIAKIQKKYPQMSEKDIKAFIKMVKK